MDGLIAFVSSKEDAVEINFIFRVFQISLKARELGREGYKRMKKGDFTNIPNIKKKITKKIVKQKVKHVKGYDINAE